MKRNVIVLCVLGAAGWSPDISGNSGGLATGSTDPNANFSY